MLDDSLGSIRLAFRSIGGEDVDRVAELTSVYGERTRALPLKVTSQIARFPAGQIAIVDDDVVIASVHSLRTTDGHLLARPTWEGATDAGLVRVHDPRGDVLLVVTLAIAKEGLPAIVSRALVRALVRRARTMGLRRVVIPAIDDPSFGPVRDALLASGFSETAYAAGFFPAEGRERRDAMLFAIELDAHVPEDEEPREGRVRVAAVQHRMQPVSSFEEAATRWAFAIATAADMGCGFVVFPELLTTELFPLVPSAHVYEAARRLHVFTDAYVDFFREHATAHGIHVIAGSHLTLEDGLLYNDAYFFHPDGRLAKQRKIHVTPWESESWGVSPGTSIEVMETPYGRVAVVICYDVEFPEVVRIARAKGAELIFVPYNTDLPSGHVRVRACAQARAIENHVYVVTAGVCGALAHAAGTDVHHAESAIFTPSDLGFARDGIAAIAPVNQETLLVAELDLAQLRRTERVGSVRTWHDRRPDLYRVRYLGGDGEMDV